MQYRAITTQSDRQINLVVKSRWVVFQTRCVDWVGERLVDFGGSLGFENDGDGGVCRGYVTGLQIQSQKINL